MNDTQDQKTGEGNELADRAKAKKKASEGTGNILASVQPSDPDDPDSERRAGK